jgi:hypothetical protein
MDVKGREISIDQVGTGGNPSLLDVPPLDSKGILEKARKLFVSYLWRGNSENRVMP